MRRFSSISLACLSIALGSASATAQDDEWDVPQPAWEGVWHGTIGTSPVHVCLDKTPYEQKGAYYYDRVKRLLRLVPGKAGGEWLEQEIDDKNGPRWRIAERGGALVGAWSNGREELPVHLTRIGGPSRDYDGPCRSQAFNRPRIAPRLTSRHATMDGARYTKWTFKPGPWFADEVEITTFTLDRPGEPVVRINALLRSVLPKADGTGDWLDCVAGTVNASGKDGTYSHIVEPTLVSSRWLAASEQEDYFCGGAHPDGFSAPRTFDLVRGAEIDPLDWFGPKAVHREDLGSEDGIYKTLTAVFRAAILQGWKPDDAECDEALRRQESWHAGITRGVLVFSPDFPHAIASCSEDFKVPFARLQPWLNDQGKAAVATLPR